MELRGKISKGLSSVVSSVGISSVSQLRQLVQRSIIVPTTISRLTRGRSTAFIPSSKIIVVPSVYREIQELIN